MNTKNILLIALLLLIILIALGSVSASPDNITVNAITSDKVSDNLTVNHIDKKIKGLKKENPRDNMTNAELVINMLGELVTTEISKTENPHGFEESKIVARDGGGIGGNALMELENRTGQKVVSSKNSKNPRLLDDDLK